MKNLKKLVSVVVALTMVISSMAFVSAKDFGDVDTSAAYAEAVDVLSDLAILNGDEAGNFNPDAEIKRSEFAAILCRALGQENSVSMGATQFTDVAAEHWASGYINWAAAAEIVNGKGNGIFDPDAPVKFEEAIKMIVVALGYEPMAAKKGGYPTGYQVAASSIGVTKGVNFVGAANASRKDVARLVYNGLDVPLMDTSYYTFSDEDEYLIYNGKNGTERRTVLSYYLDIVKAKAVVLETATSKGATHAKKDGNDTVKLSIESLYDFAWNAELLDGVDSKGDDTVILAGNSGVDAYLAQDVIAYIGTNDDDKEILISVVGATKASASLEVSDNIEAMTSADGVSFTFKYYENEDDANAEEVSIANNARVFVNGVEVTGADAKKAAYNGKAADVASVKFMASSDYEGEADYNLIFITQYAYAVVVSANADTEVIKLTRNSLDLSKETRGKTFSYTLKLEDGTEIGLEDLEKNDVLNIACEETTIAGIRNNNAISKMEIIVTRNAVEGSIEEEVTAGKTYVINGSEYDVANDVSTLTPGESGRFLMSVDGKLIYQDDEWVSEESAATRNYGFVLAIGDDTSFEDIIYQVKMFTTDGAIVTYNVAEKLDIYYGAAGTKVAKAEVDVELSGEEYVLASEDLTTIDTQNDVFEPIKDAFAAGTKSAATTNVAKRLVAYELNSNDEIKAIRIAYAGSATSTKALAYNVVASGKYEPDEDEFCGSVFTSKSLYIVAPIKGTAADSSDWVVDTDDLEIVNADALDEETTYTNTIMFDIDDEEMTFDLAVITSDLGTNRKSALAVAYAKSTLSDGAEKISFYQAGEFKSLVINEDCETEIEIGDTFQYTVVGDEIAKATIIFDYSAKADALADEDDTNDDTTFEDGFVDGTYYDAFYTMEMGSKYAIAVGSASIDGNVIEYTAGAKYVYGPESELGTVALYTGKKGQNAIKAMTDLTDMYVASESYTDKGYAYYTIVKYNENNKVVDAVQYQVAVTEAFPS